ncbi:uncharacterized protein LOC110739432 [Chenopodium quinoa]|uniref:uncharacterized protein LOC110739432 n=1 Tax=Chenopodium quinoa TaxID=63459 RepID=UPI000B784288|nr:uncharacterized protein LOC110739432 [Chenopodium quinoa]
MTCNANWPEIKPKLAAGELAQNQPDLVARIFRAKLLALKKEIMEKKVLGEVAAMIYVVEFQKRGLPHAHFLIILKPQYKLKCPADYDRFVCAEIPSANDTMLRKIILGHMMHGPCGELNQECPCMRTNGLKKTCKNKYPKQYAAETTNNKDGYLIYRRRNTGEKVKIRGAQLDNQWVIPYIPYLSMLFDCHLNVEVCCTIKAVKYLYKYVYKGHDKISYTIVPDATKPIDEIEQYQSGRWVSPCKAAWRIFSFELFEMYPPVLPLQVHLPNMQIVHLHPHEKLNSVVANSKRFRTQLTEFFAVNADTEGGTGHLYGEFCEQLAFVFPAEGERFSLRLLLLNVRSPTSFEDLRTVNGQIYPTFKEAALKLGLIEHDDIANLTLSEVCQVQMLVALRRLFATVLMFCQAIDPEALWHKYYSHLSEDYRLQFPDNSQKIHRLTVRAMEQYLEGMGKSLATFSLEHLNSQFDEEFRRTKDIIDALDAPIPEECLNCRSRLNPEQNVAFTNIMQYVMEKKPGAFFIDGPGGTGKTFLYNALYAEVCLMNKIVLPTATSGIVAANIPSGRTAHFRFKIPIDSEASLARDVPKQSSLVALLKEATLIIWDEVSMAKKQNIESLDLLLQDLCQNNVLFGGKIVVFGGDFRQVLPVVPQKTMKEAVETSIVTSYVWPKFIKFKLTKNIRAREDLLYSAFLLALGNGDLQDTEVAFIRLPTTVTQTFENKTDLIYDLTRATFPEITEGHFHPNTFTKKAILTPLNDDVDSINSFMINDFPGKPATYKSFDTMLNDTCNVYPT